MESINKVIRKDLDAVFSEIPVSKQEKEKEIYKKRENRKLIDPDFAQRDSERKKNNHIDRQKKKEQEQILFPHLAHAKKMNLVLNYDEDTIKRCFLLYKESLLNGRMFPPLFFFIFLLPNIYFSNCLSLLVCI